ncbi:DUF2189 domain-containing protein [Jannaschia ovalis]|uniref:DUF2189 domain-containing protein n=1 Tax=Jannaschia ovalis TaxID=3038773 RepID=A0ABY8L888_9RHOB|nr:DUF2189 domain-containing protein [Jannaschia sp. GRR-S6-38]WGH77575.1 DUF2189 domain-containing protein [Jannaschia sp. GRR-S6-38]
MALQTEPHDDAHGHLAFADLRAALAAGWRDFRAAPQYGLFFAGIYVIAGLVLTQLGAGLFTWTLTMSLGFPLVAPFLAVGLYEVSRRRQSGEPLTFSNVLGVVWQERTRQIPWAGAVIVIYFLFWSFFAHMLFALIMGPSVLSGPPGDLASYLSGRGLTALLVELGVGALWAFLLFALTVVSLPMLLEREIDFVTAMLRSLALVRDNPVVMLAWAALIGTSLFLAMLPWFLGLLVVLPVLGHASWHLYRRSGV